ncbi:MAG: hypothetical protein ABI662_05105 [Dermatophilaceae bacterium]
MDVESVSDELYGLALDEFVSTRTDRERQARSLGDKALAARIHRLPKPTLVAWLANQLARQGADELRPLLDLGVALREATATLSGDQLRELSRQQRQLVHALVQQARRLASAEGRKVSENTARGLEDTLRAAIADPDAADALANGRLTAAMQNSGFGALAGGGGEPVSANKPSPGLAQSATTSKDVLEHRERAKDGVAKARSAVEKAVAASQDALDRLEAADQAVAESSSRVERARRHLDEALGAQSAAQEDQRRALAAAERAGRGANDANDARQRQADAHERYDRSAR